MGTSARDLVRLLVTVVLLTFIATPANAGGRVDAESEKGCTTKENCFDCLEGHFKDSQRCTWLPLKAGQKCIASFLAQPGERISFTDSRKNHGAITAHCAREGKLIQARKVNGLLKNVADPVLALYNANFRNWVNYFEQYGEEENNDKPRNILGKIQGLFEKLKQARTRVDEIYETHLKLSFEAQSKEIIEIYKDRSAAIEAAIDTVEPAEKAMGLFIDVSDHVSGGVKAMRDYATRSQFNEDVETFIDLRGKADLRGNGALLVIVKLTEGQFVKALKLASSSLKSWESHAARRIDKGNWLDVKYSYENFKEFLRVVPRADKSDAEKVVKDLEASTNKDLQAKKRSLDHIKHEIQTIDGETATSAEAVAFFPMIKHSYAYSLEIAQSCAIKFGFIKGMEIKSAVASELAELERDTSEAFVHMFAKIAPNDCKMAFLARRQDTKTDNLFLTVGTQRTPVATWYQQLQKNKLDVSKNLKSLYDGDWDNISKFSDWSPLQLMGMKQAMEKILMFAKEALDEPDTMMPCLGNARRTLMQIETRATRANKALTHFSSMHLVLKKEVKERFEAGQPLKVAFPTWTKRNLLLLVHPDKHEGYMFKKAATEVFKALDFQKKTITSGLQEQLWFLASLEDEGRARGKAVQEAYELKFISTKNFFTR